MTEEKELLFVEGSIQKHKEFVPPEVLFQELIERVQKYHPSDDVSPCCHCSFECKWVSDCNNFLSNF